MVSVKKKNERSTRRNDTTVRKEREKYNERTIQQGKRRNHYKKRIMQLQGNNEQRTRGHILLHV